MVSSAAEGGCAPRSALLELRSTGRAPQPALHRTLTCFVAGEGTSTPARATAARSGDPGACAPGTRVEVSGIVGLNGAESWWERRNSVYFRLPICAVPGVTVNL